MRRSAQPARAGGRGRCPLGSCVPFCRILPARRVLYSDTRAPTRSRARDTPNLIDRRGKNHGQVRPRPLRKTTNVVLISFHRSLRFCALNGLQALHATLLHSECNVATDRMVCSILCLMLHALTRSRPQDQLPFSFCLQNCMSVARFLGLCDHMHRFLSKFCCLKRSLGEAALWLPDIRRFVQDCAIGGTCVIQVFSGLAHEASLRKGEDLWKELFSTR